MNTKGVFTRCNCHAITSITIRICSIYDRRTRSCNRLGNSYYGGASDRQTSVLSYKGSSQVLGGSHRMNQRSSNQ